MLSALATGMLLFAGCKESASTQEQEEKVKTTTVGIQANLGRPELNGGAASVNGSLYMIDNMDVTVRDASTDQIYKNDVAMTYSNGKWTALLENLPVDKSLVFTVDAYEQDSDISSDMVKTFSGVTYQALQAGDTVNVALASTLSPNVVNMPQLYSTELTENVAVDQTTDIRLLIRGRDNTTVQYTINSEANGGKFSSNQGEITLNGNSATLVLKYTASLASLGVQKHIIRLRDSSGNEILTAFKTTVVLAQENSNAMVAQFAPRVLGIKMLPDWLNNRNNSDYVYVIVYMEDDNGAESFNGQVTYEKDSSGDSSYMRLSACYTNRCNLILDNYTPETSGWMRFTATDADGLTTSVSTYISKNMFPDPAE